MNKGSKMVRLLAGGAVLAGMGLSLVLSNLWWVVVPAAVAALLLVASALPAPGPGEKAARALGVRPPADKDADAG